MFKSVIICSVLFFSLPFSAHAFLVCFENAAYEPYMVHPEQTDKTKPGILVELVTKAAESAGLQIRFTRAPWKRCKLNVRNGNADALFAMIWTEEREAEYTFPKNPEGKTDDNRAIWKAEYPVFTYQNSLLKWDGIKFHQLNFGLSAPPGYVAISRLKDLNALYPDTLIPEQGLKLVSLQRLDGYIIERWIGKSLNQRLKLSNLTTLNGKPFMEAYWHIPVSKDFYTNYPQKTEEFWNALRQIRQEDTSDLLKRYNLSEQ